MRKQPEEIWCENGIYYDYEHDGGIKYVRADHIEAQAAEIERLRGDLKRAVEALEDIAYGGSYTDMRIARTTLAELTGAKDD